MTVAFVAFTAGIQWGDIKVSVTSIRQPIVIISVCYPASSRMDACGASCSFYCRTQNRRSSGSGGSRKSVGGSSLVSKAKQDYVLMLFLSHKLGETLVIFLRPVERGTAGDLEPVVLLVDMSA